MKVISSMATRQLLADHVATLGLAAQLLPMGGVEAARRVREGEVCDVVVLAADAIDRLQQSGHVDASARIDWVRSGVAVAVPAGAVRPDISNGAAVRQAVVAANRIGVSTGPSGVALTALFARWGLADAVAAKTVQAPPGVPVASLVARGDADLGFQQLSELLDADGITLVGLLPDDIQIWTTFSAAVATTTLDAAAAAAFLHTLSHPARAEATRRHGMEPLTSTTHPRP